MKWGVNNDGSWVWRTVKFSDNELGLIIRVLERKISEASFFHSFNDDKISIWFKLSKDTLICKADDMTKGLNPGEQKVLHILLQHAIIMMNLTSY